MIRQRLCVLCGKSTANFRKSFGQGFSKPITPCVAQADEDAFAVRGDFQFSVLCSRKVVGAAFLEEVGLGADFGSCLGGNYSADGETGCEIRRRVGDLTTQLNTGFRSRAVVSAGRRRLAQ
jgi:hypothetical protein